MRKVRNFMSTFLFKKIKYILFGFILLVMLLVRFFYGNYFTEVKDSNLSDEKVESLVVKIGQDILSPVATLTEQKISTRQKVLVTKVIDGDTIEIEGGQKVRYIGINTPETVHTKKAVECYGRQASDKNKELVEGKFVELEKDVSEVDKYGRLLRYVWLDDVLINEYLVREGYGQSSTYPPDVKYQDRILEAQRLAREEERGLWSSYCDPQNTPEPSISPTGEYVCDCKKTCSQMSSCEEAQYQLNVCGCKQRDGDKDGIACNGAPLRCQ